MPLSSCSKCDKLYDWDGFFEHSQETLYWCGCGAIFDKANTFYLHDQIDFTGMPDGYVNSGMFIWKSRLKG